MPTNAETVRAYARLAPVIPVVTIEDARRSIDLAQTLVEAGLPVVEVTLRTKAALDAHTMSGFEAAIERELEGQTELLQSPEFQAAIAAFAGKK